MHSPPSLGHRLQQKRKKEGIPLVDSSIARFVNTFAYPVGFLGLAGAMPQVYDVWVLGHVEGVSLITWSIWTITSIFWMLYARAHKASALTFLNSCWFFVNGFVAIGIFVNS